MLIYACINQGMVQAQINREEPADGFGPMDVHDLVQHYEELWIIPARIRRTADLTETAMLFWNGGVPEFRETLSLGNAKLATLATVDGEADVARARILAAPTNAEEYRPTFEQARAFKDANYEGPVPPGVSTWTHAKRRQGWTDKDATDDILATAAGWTGLLWYIRGLRLDIKELVRDATTIYEVELLLEVFRESLAVAMAGVH